MNTINLSNIMDAVKNKVQEKVTAMAKEIETFMKYDAMVEGIDTSEIEVSVNQTSETEYSISLHLEKLNDYYKQLVRDIYFKNALSRRKGYHAFSVG